MYIRTRKNESGSTSVFVVASKRFKNKKHPRPIIVKSFGSSRDPKEISLLREKAIEFASENKYTPFLRINKEEEINTSKVKTIGFEEVYGSIFKRYFADKDMRLKNVDYKILKELVLMRIAQPLSKLKTSEIAPDYNLNELTINKIYKFMDSLNNKAIEKIKGYIFSNSKKLLGNDNLKVLFYDLTTIAFENNTTSDLKRFGFSKDGKNQHVQISMALIVTDFGLPLGYEIFPGNIYEGKTLLPVLLKLRKNYNARNVTVVADSAMLNKVNLEKLKVNHFSYIVAARIKNLKGTVTKQLLDKENYISLNEDISYKIIKLDDISLVACHSKKRERKDEYERKVTIERLNKILGKSVKDKLRGSLKKPYIKLSNQSTIMLDEQKLEEAKRFDGYFGFCTNTNISAEEVIAQYRGLWQVERTFRITKHNLSIRPVYHYKDRRIAAHFAICFLALALIRTTEFLLAKNNQQISSEVLHHLLDQIKVTKLTVKEQEFKIVSDLPPEIYPILDVLNIKKPKVFSYQESN